MLRRLVPGALLALFLAAPAAHAAASSRVLTHAVLSRLANATRLAAAAPETRMRIGVALVRPDRDGEEAFVQRVYNPSSPDFHRFLTPAQFAQRFGVRAAAADATRAWLRSGGLSIERTSGARDYVLASGTVAQIEALTRTAIARYAFAGTTFLANDRPPTVPASLPIGTIIGLNTWERHHTAHAEGAALGLTGRVPAGTNVGNQEPEDLWSIYEQPSGVTGAGVPVAILGNGQTDQVIKDLHQFDRKHGFAELPVEVNRVPANGDFSDDSGDVEWNIDMQAIHGMAPGIAKEVLYFAPTLADTELVAATKAWVDDPHGPPIMNASLGECEVTPLNDLLNDQALYPINGNENNTGSALPVSQGLSNSSEPMQTALLRQAVLEGRTLFAASGDSGSSCTAIYPGTNGVGNYGVPLTEDPANNPYAVGVGGTVLYSDGNTPAARAAEYAWTHSGGNASPFLPMPEFEKVLSFPLERPCLLPDDGSSSRCRGVPDVAALSGDVISNGYAIVSGGQDGGGGGTSLSSPLWAGMWARLASTAPAGSPGYGFANEAIYKVAAKPDLYASSFYDITQGSNGLNPAVTGYDYVTGLGVPKLSGLIAAVRQVAPAPEAPRPGPTGSMPTHTSSPPAHRTSGSSATRRAAKARRKKHAHKKRTAKHKTTTHRKRKKRLRH